MPKKLKIELPYDPVIPLLGIYPKECAPGYDRASCTPMFIESLFMIIDILNGERWYLIVVLICISLTD
jgi:hypothetical protein